MLTVGELRRALEGLRDEDQVKLLVEGLCGAMEAARETSWLDPTPSAEAKLDSVLPVDGRLIICVEVEVTTDENIDAEIDAEIEALEAGDPGD